MFEVLRISAQYAIALMGIPKGERNTPADFWPSGDFFIAFPSDIVCGVSNSKYGIEQEIDLASTRTDQ